MVSSANDEAGQGKASCNYFRKRLQQRAVSGQMQEIRRWYQENTVEPRGARRFWTRVAGDNNVSAT